MSAGHNREQAPYRIEQGLTRYLETNNAYKAEGYDMSVHQEPIHSVCHCSDSRQKAELATGQNALGKSLEIAVPGGFLTGPDGKLTSDAGRWLELTVAYGIQRAAVVQHSGCGQMNVIYTYHMVDGGKDAIRGGKGDFFANDAELRKPLVEEVKKNGLTSYEAMGIPLVGDDASKFQQAMAVQQLLWDMTAVEAARKANPHIPAVEGQFQHIVAGRFFKLESLEGKKFVEVKAA